MHKEIVLLATSKKHKNYCVAGIDKDTGEWVRIISDDPYIDHAVNESDMRYEDGSFPKLLEVIRIQIKSHNPNYYQPENFLFDGSYYWEKIGDIIPNDLVHFRALNRDSYIFYNNERRIESDFIERLEDHEKHSLTAVLIKNPVVVVQEWPERKTVAMDFYYNNHKYGRIPITDINFINKYLSEDKGSYPINNNYVLIISLGENFEGYHYKLIAGVIELK